MLTSVVLQPSRECLVIMTHRLVAGLSVRITCNCVNQNDSWGDSAHGYVAHGLCFSSAHSTYVTKRFKLYVTTVPTRLHPLIQWCFQSRMPIDSLAHGVIPELWSKEGISPKVLEIHTRKVFNLKRKRYDWVLAWLVCVFKSYSHLGAINTSNPTPSKFIHVLSFKVRLQKYWNSTEANNSM